MSGASFKGNLEILNLSDIFQSLAMNRHSGTLCISDGKREKKIYFSEGEIQLLSSSRRMKLGELLIATGKIAEEDLDLALKLQKQNRKKLGEILVEEGFCDEEDVARIVKFQIEEEIYDLFLWRKAEFEFIADHIPEDMKRESSNLMRLSLNTNSLIMEALRRLDEWELVKQAVPSTKEIFVIADQAKLEQVELPERLRHEIHLIDGKTNVEGLAEKTMVSEFELCKLLADLVHQGAIAALPMEQLVQRAEEAYAVNDFGAAANLYGRLAELAPGEPKVLIPLAESLRRSGDDRQALIIFESIASKLDPARDGERLRRCYETIVALDPERADIVKKLADMESRAQSRRRSGVATPFFVVLLLAGAGVVAVYHKPIAAWFVKMSKDQGVAKRAEEDALAEQLLQQMSVAKVGKDYAKWHALGVEIWNKYPRTKAREKVTLPVLVRTVPGGYAVTINKLLHGVTSAQQPVIEATYSTLVDKVTIQVRKLPPGASPNTIDFDTPPRAERILDDPKKFAGEVVFTIEDKPDNGMVADAPIEVEFAVHPATKTWLAVGRDGAVYALDEALKRQDGWKDVTLGQYGDVFTSATIVNDRAYVGASTGGVAVIDLAKKTVLNGLFPVEGGSVTGHPLVVSSSDRVIFGTSTGAIYGFSRDGGKPKWRQEADSAVAFAGVLADDQGEAVVFGSTDERLRSFEVATGKPLWSKWPIVGIPCCQPLRAGDAILVANTDGDLLAVDSKTGKVREQHYHDPNNLPLKIVLDEAGEHVFAASEDGRFQAFDVKDLTKQLWAPAFSRPTTRAPSIAYLRKTSVNGSDLPERILASFDDSHLFVLDTKTGQLVWQGNMDTGFVAGPITVRGESFLVPTSAMYVHLFQRQ
jgi:outer membrane protein assembly factor BamB